MEDSIRNRIIKAVESKLAEIRVSKGYASDIGSRVLKARRRVDPDECPAVDLFPGIEEISPGYSVMTLTMPFQAEAFVLYGNENPSDVGEKVLADLIENVTGNKWVLPFTSGGPHEIQAGETIEGATSQAAGHVEAVNLVSGSWESGDAEGNVTIRRKSGNFQAEKLKVGPDEDVADTTGIPTYQSAISTTTAGLAESIEYESGGIETYPDDDEKTVGIMARFRIRYQVKGGNPYSRQA